MNKDKSAVGRPKPVIPRKMLSIRLPIDIIDSIPGNKTQFIETAIKDKLLEIVK